MFWVSHSADEYALSLIRAGQMDMTVNMPVNDMAGLSLEYALKLVKGEKLQPGNGHAQGSPVVALRRSSRARRGWISTSPPGR